MYRVISCLTDQHDYRLVILAVVICGLSTFTAFYIYRSARQTQGYRRLGWIILAGVATGAGIWATHFVAMLAFKTGLPTAYDPALTALSLLIAIVVTAAGLLTAVHGKSRLYAGLGGAIIGFGIADMHYIGMSAFSTMGTVSWDRTLVTSSIVFGVAFSSAALLKYHEGQRLAVVSAAGLLTIAICTLHFTAMGAAIITPDPTVHIYPTLFDNSTMALAVAGVSSLVVLAALAAALIDRESARETALRLRELADAAVEGIVVAKDGVIVNVNKRVLDLSEHSPDQLLGTMVFGDLLLAQRDSSLRACGRLETAMLTASGQSVPVEVSYRPYWSDMRANEVYALRDLREQREAENRIRTLAHCDSLTGLANRATIRVRLDDILEKANAQAHPFAIICIDLRQFREINDLHGHDEGDRVLMTSADRMLRTLKSGELLGRMGGDEFVVVQSKGQQPEAAAALANRLVEALGAPLEIDGVPAVVTASIGIALYPHNGRSAEELLANADIALYRAKGAGCGAICFFEPEMDLAVRRRRRLGQDLRTAIAEESLELLYQPQVNLISGAIEGFEAIACWSHPEHGMMLSDEFTPIADQSGLGVLIAEWTLRTACLEATRWPSPYKLCVSLSVGQFQGADFSDIAHHILFETGLSPTRLTLEITETALIEDRRRSVEVLRRLRALGVDMTMDGFGTGYSSLLSLQAFPFTKIRVARDLIQRLGRSKQAALIVKSVLGLGKSLDTPVLAEGVETRRQYEMLRALGFEQAQGYYFGLPASSDGIRQLLREGRVELSRSTEGGPSDSPARRAASNISYLHEARRPQHGGSSSAA